MDSPPKGREIGNVFLGQMRALQFHIERVFDTIRDGYRQYNRLDVADSFARIFGRSILLAKDIERLFLLATRDVSTTFDFLYSTERPIRISAASGYAVACRLALEIGSDLFCECLATEIADQRNVFSAIESLNAESIELRGEIFGDLLEKHSEKAAAFFEEVSWSVETANDLSDRMDREYLLIDGQIRLLPTESVQRVCLPLHEIDDRTWDQIHREVHTADTVEKEDESHDESTVATPSRQTSKLLGLLLEDNMLSRPSKSTAKYSLSDSQSRLVKAMIDAGEDGIPMNQARRISKADTQRSLSTRKSQLNSILKFLGIATEQGQWRLVEFNDSTT